MGRAKRERSDMCKHCGWYTPNDGEIAMKGLAYCGGWKDRIAKDAKTAKACSRWKERGE